MGDDPRRPMTDEERARIQAARRDGGLCGLCGRALAEGEAVWIERLGVGTRYAGRGAVYWRAPVCAECASPATRAAIEGSEPERCANCGRGVYYEPGHRLRHRAFCSRRCAGRERDARAREARGSE